MSAERPPTQPDDPSLDLSCPQCAGTCRVLYDAGGPHEAHRHHKYDCPHCGRENGLTLAGYVIRVVKAED